MSANKISIEQAEIALDSLDDFARMSTGVDAKGPRTILEKFIDDQRQNYRLADSIHHLGSCLMVMGLFIMGGLIINGVLS